MEQELNRDERELLQNQLMKGEELKWAGRPIPSYFSLASGLLFFSSIPLLCFGGFALWDFILPMYQESEGQDPFLYIFCAAFLIPIAIMLVVTLTAPLRHHAQSKRLLYAITDKRAIICHRKSLGKLAIKAFPVKKDMVRECKIKAGGSGDILFTDAVELYGRSDNKPGLIAYTGFTNLYNLRETQSVLEKVIHATETPNN